LRITPVFEPRPHRGHRFAHSAGRLSAGFTAATSDQGNRCHLPPT